MGCGLQKRRFWRQAVAAAALALGLGLAPPAPAQAQADTGFLGGLVQSALSGPGRDVRIDVGGRRMPGAAAHTIRLGC